MSPTFRSAPLAASTASGDQRRPGVVRRPPAALDDPRVSRLRRRGPRGRCRCRRPSGLRHRCGRDPPARRARRRCGRWRTARADSFPASAAGRRPPPPRRRTRRPWLGRNVGEDQRRRLARGDPRHLGEQARLDQHHRGQQGRRPGRWPARPSGRPSAGRRGWRGRSAPAPRVGRAGAPGRPGAGAAEPRQQSTKARATPPIITAAASGRGRRDHRKDARGAAGGEDRADQSRRPNRRRPASSPAEQRRRAASRRARASGASEKAAADSRPKAAALASGPG